MCWTCQMNNEAECRCQNDDHHVEDINRKYRDEDPYQHLSRHPRVWTAHRNAEENKEMARNIEHMREETAAIQTAQQFLKDLLGDPPLRGDDQFKFEIANTLKRVAEKIESTREAKRRNVSE